MVEDGRGGSGAQELHQGEHQARRGRRVSSRASSRRSSARREADSQALACCAGRSRTSMRSSTVGTPRPYARRSGQVKDVVVEVVKARDDLAGVTADSPGETAGRLQSARRACRGRRSKGPPSSAKASCPALAARRGARRGAAPANCPTNSNPEVHSSPPSTSPTNRFREALRAALSRQGVEPGDA